MKVLEKVGEKLSVILGPFSEFMNTNKFAIAIRESLVIPMILIMVGSFANILNVYICTENGLAGFEAFAWLANYGKVFTNINFACISCLALVSALLIGYKLGESNKINPLQGALIGMACFIILVDTDNLKSQFGAQALFLAFFSSIFGVQIFTAFMKNEKLLIKMPKQTPVVIADTFRAMFPAAMTVLIFGLIGGTLYGATGLYVNDIIYKFIQMPFVNIVDSRLGATMIALIIMVSWWLGIHGNSVVKPITETITAYSLAANIDQLNAGITPTHIYTMSFQNLFICLGGTGVVIGLILAILIFSKREDYRQVAKIGLVPSIFNISEPVVFGLPIMYNPTLLIPFILTPLVTVNLGYTLLQSGWLTPGVVRMPGRTPLILQAFLDYTSVRGALVSLLVIAISVLMYAPFIIMANKQKIGEGE